LELIRRRRVYRNRYIGVDVIGAAGARGVRQFVFKASIVAVVRVRAADENAARTIVADVLGAPGAADIGLTNQNHAALGRDATVTDVDFDVRSIKLANGGSG
jgi:hypothetical protein